MKDFLFGILKVVSVIVSFALFVGSSLLSAWLLQKLLIWWIFDNSATPTVTSLIFWGSYLVCIFAEVGLQSLAFLPMMLFFKDEDEYTIEPIIGCGGQICVAVQTIVCFIMLFRNIKELIA